MKRASKLFALIVALSLLTASVSALAEFGSGAVTSGQTYTTEQMLTYAIQDEYFALAEYQAIIAKYGAARPFTNIMKAEQHHIDLLKPLFAAYEAALPENDAASQVALPETLTLAYETGVKAEIRNIAMYAAFLTQTLPADVKAVFTSLKAASENHLSSFERKSSGQTGSSQGIRNGRGNRNGKGNDNGRGNGNGNGRGRGNASNGGNQGGCPNCSSIPVA